MRSANHLLEILKVDMQKQRDTAPYLLESLKALREPDDTWRHIAQYRAFFHADFSLEKAEEFEKELLAYIVPLNFKALNFLEAKKDILDLSEIIKKDKSALVAAYEKWNTRIGVFPFILAGKIFGFQEVKI
jgi:hypothetical protein